MLPPWLIFDLTKDDSCSRGMPWQVKQLHVSFDLIGDAASLHEFNPMFRCETRWLEQMWWPLLQMLCWDCCFARCIIILLVCWKVWSRRWCCCLVWLVTQWAKASMGLENAWSNLWCRKDWTDQMGLLQPSWRRLIVFNGCCHLLTLWVWSMSSQCHDQFRWWLAGVNAYWQCLYDSFSVHGRVMASH